MYKNILQSIDGIEIFPLISFAIFFGFFVILLVYVVLADRNHLNAMRHLPLLTDADQAEIYKPTSKKKQ